MTGPVCRKAVREALNRRIQEVLKSDPQPSRILAERFGVTASIIARMARRLGIKLPTSQYPRTRREQRRKKKEE